jgi:colicin import membrane protein
VHVNRSQLVAEAAKRTGLEEKTVDAALRGILEVVASVVAKGKDKVTIPGWVGFEQVARAARKARNPQTGEVIKVAKSKSVKVTAGATLKNIAAGKVPAPAAMKVPAKPAGRSAKAAAKAAPAKAPSTGNPAKPEPAKPDAAEPAPEPKAENAEPLPQKKPEPKPALPRAAPRPKPQTAKAPASPAPTRPVAQQEQKFDTDRITALLNKTEPTPAARPQAPAEDKPSLGTATGRGAKLTASEIDALRARLAECWNIPAGARDAERLVVRVQFSLNPDGSLNGAPAVVEATPGPYSQVAAEAAVRAVRICQPYTMLPSAKYEEWRDNTINFNPREMFGG